MKRALFFVSIIAFFASASFASAATLVIPSSVPPTQAKQLKLANTDVQNSPRDASAWFTLAGVYRSIASSSTAAFAQKGYWDALRKGIVLRFGSLSEPKTPADAYEMARLFSDDWTENRGLAATSPWRDMDAYAKLMAFVSMKKGAPGWSSTSTELQMLDAKDATLENVMLASKSVVPTVIDDGAEQYTFISEDDALLNLRFSLWQLTMGFACGVSATVFVFIVWQLFRHAVMHHHEHVPLKSKRVVKRGRKN